MKKIILLTTFIIITTGGPAAAYQWQSVHERVEQLPPETDAEALAADALDAENLYLAGLMALRRHEAERAERLFARILSVEADSIPARWGMAEVRRFQRRYDDSIKRLLKIIDEDPSFVPAYLTLAYVYFIRLEFQKSTEVLSRVIKMGISKMDVKSLVQAHGLYAAVKGTEVLSSSPLKRGVNFFAIKRHLGIVRDLQPESFTAHFGYGCYYMSLPPIFGRDLPKAKELLLKAKDQDPYFPDVYARLAQYYKITGDEARYEQYLQEALRRDPANELAIDLRDGTCLYVCLEEK